jgi:hypothetical protein
LPSESDYARLSRELAAASGEYRPEMFTKRNSYYTGMDEAGAAVVKNNDVSANTIQQRYESARKVLADKQASIEKSSKYKKAKTDVERAKIVKDGTVAERQAVNDLKTERTRLVKDNVLQYDPKTKTYNKTAEHIQKANDVEAQFITSGKTKTELQTEFNALPKESAGSHEATFRAQRDKNIDDLITNELSRTKRSGDSMLWDADYGKLSPDEQKIVSDILNKRIGYDDLSEEDIRLLNYYTQKAKGVNVTDADIRAARSASDKNALDSDDFKNFKLDDSVGIDTVNALLQKAGLPKSKYHFNETT